MAPLDEVARGEVAAQLVVEAHLVAGQPLDEAVDHDEGGRELREVRDEPLVCGKLVRDDDEQPVDAAVHEQTHELRVVLRTVV